MKDHDDRPVSFGRSGFVFPNWAVGLVAAGLLILIAAAVVAFSLDIEPDARVQIIYQIALIVAGLVGLPLAIWRSLTAHRQAEAALGQLKATEAQLQNTERQIALATENHIADRLQRGAEMLGSEHQAVRTAGLATLSYVGRDESSKFTRAAGDIIASFVSREGRLLDKDDLFIVEALDALLHIHRRLGTRETFRVDGAIIESIVREFDSRCLTGTVRIKGTAVTHSYVGTSVFEFEDADVRWSILDSHFLYGFDESTNLRVMGSQLRGRAGASIEKVRFRNCDFSRLTLRDPYQINGEGNFYWDDGVPEIPKPTLKALLVRPASEQDAWRKRTLPEFLQK